MKFGISWPNAFRYYHSERVIAYDLLDEPLRYKTYGGKFIETLAKQQMNLAMRLPVTVAGALMPDAHAGYGLPIGGVLATDNVVIPYAVGVDIGCRMSLTVFDASADFLKRYTYQMKEALKISPISVWMADWVLSKNMRCWIGKNSV